MRVAKQLGLFKLLLAAFLVTVFVACQRPGQQPPGSEGTSDGGGGTGFNGKLYESYIVDLSKHPAFIKHVEPIFKRILDKTPAGARWKMFPWHEMWRLKTWYIAPIKLKKSFSKEVLGYTSSDGDYEIYAVNREREIVIDKNLFDKMSEKEQADVFVHEIIMSIYLFKFKQMSEVCHAFQTVVGGKCENVEEVNPLYPPVAARALNEQDNVNIRTMTGVLLTVEALSSENVMEKFIENQFDARYFKRDWEQQQGTETVQFAPGEIAKMLIEAKVLNKLPIHCTFTGLKKGGACEASVQETEMSVPNGKVPALELVLTFQGQEFREKILAGANGMASPIFDPLNNRQIFLIPGAKFGLANPKVGDLHRHVFLVAGRNTTGEDKSLKLEAIFFSPVVVTSVTQTGPGTAVCTGGRPNPKQLSEDVIIARVKNETVGYIEFLSERLFVGPPCL